LSLQYKSTGDLNKDNPLGTEGKLLEEFADLLRQMWSAKIGEKSPTRFRVALGKANELFQGADQQDSQEFLSFILDILHEDSNRVRRKPAVEGLEDHWKKNTSLSRVGEEEWRRYVLADCLHW
jgi:ubiquitin C-terminal hydrolase